MARAQHESYPLNKVLSVKHVTVDYRDNVVQRCLELIHLASLRLYAY